MSKSMTEAYHAWLKANPDAAGWQEGPPYWDAFVAGAAAEREAVLAIINEEQTPIGLVGSIVNYPILEARIRQRGEK